MIALNLPPTVTEAPRTVHWSVLAEGLQWVVSGRFAAPAGWGLSDTDWQVRSKLSHLVVSVPAAPHNAIGYAVDQKDSKT